MCEVGSKRSWVVSFWPIVTRWPSTYLLLVLPIPAVAVYAVSCDKIVGLRLRDEA